MLELAAFADEISPKLDEQIEHCLKHGVRGIELRSIEKRNVLDLDAAQCREIKARFSDKGLRVVSIGSPIGKVAIDEPFEPHLDRFKKALELAKFFNAPFIRVFSYYKGADGALARDEVIGRFRTKVDLVGKDGPVLVHENEKDIFGEGVRACHDLLQSVNSPKLKAVFDFANFVQVGEDPRENWPLLMPFTVHFHIKDAVAGSGKVVPAGQGDGHLGEILTDAYTNGYRGILSLEPHLAAEGQFSGFSGPKLFGEAVAALKKLAAAQNIPLAV